MHDLSPLAGTALQRIHLAETPVSDLTPLAGLPLTRLIFTPSTVSKGIDQARAIPTLREVGVEFEKRMNTQEFWKQYDAGLFK